jgi:hypothetical protein
MILKTMRIKLLYLPVIASMLRIKQSYVKM